MQIQINFANIPASDALDGHVRERINHDLKRFGERLTRIEAHLHDENEKKRGPADKKCVLEARPRGLDPIAVEDRADDFFQAVTGATRKLQHALDTRFGKLEHT